MEDITNRHIFVFNEDDEDGEQLILITEFIEDEDGDLHTHQELLLESYGNAASFHLCGAKFTPENLRRLADELEEAQTNSVGEDEPESSYNKN